MANYTEIYRHFGEWICIFSITFVKGTPKMVFINERDPEPKMMRQKFFDAAQRDAVQFTEGDIYAVEQRFIDRGGDVNNFSIKKLARLSVPRATASSWSFEMKKEADQILDHRRPEAGWMQGWHTKIFAPAPAPVVTKGSKCPPYVKW